MSQSRPADSEIRRVSVRLPMSPVNRMSAGSLQDIWSFATRLSSLPAPVLAEGYRISRKTESERMIWSPARQSECCDK